ncbi:YjeF N-terminal domain-containing protein [Pilobolus umbonatus]|nr:YjeF N-terminal domain-containing protein [Pilobolus umbonatus]
MTEHFLGLRVSILLHSGMRLEGTVYQLEPTTQQMTLKEVTLYFFGLPPHSTPVYGVYGKDIKDLQLIPPTTDNTPTQQTTLDHSVLDPLNTPTENKPTSRSNSYRNKKKTTRRKNVSDGWADEDVSIFKEEEFDFQKNLDMFDKAKVFAEIRESDETAPEELLVTLNRLPQKNKVNLLPRENVLEPQRFEPEDAGDESDDDSQTPDEYLRKVKKRSKPLTKIVTTKNQTPCVLVSPLQMAHVEHECTRISSHYEELALENGGRGSAVLILQQLGQMDVISPSIAIIVGNNKNGALGLVIACHLVNHGCTVTVCIASMRENLCQAIVDYETKAIKMGARVLYTTEELEEHDLVVDSILGSDEKLVDVQDKMTYHIICNAIQWANYSCKSIISIDFPSGVDASTGIPYNPECYIRPQRTICLGAPKTGCRSIQITGELYLVDIGIPKLCWKKIGIKGNVVPWGADFVVGLEYDAT